MITYWSAPRILTTGWSLGACTVLGFVQKVGCLPSALSRTVGEPPPSGLLGPWHEGQCAQLFWMPGAQGHSLGETPVFRGSDHEDSFHASA